MVKNLMTLQALGCIATPKQGNAMSPMWDIIADNGCFSGRWTEYDWLTWLEALSKQVPIRFAVAPDVFDQSGEECHWPTVELWEKYAPMIRDLGLEPAFVGQEGCTKDLIPDDAGVIFLGGSNEFKLGPHGAEVSIAAKRAGSWVHMGRVNSIKRILYANSIGCDSVDGTCLTFGADANLPRMLEGVTQARVINALTTKEDIAQHAKANLKKDIK